MKLHNNQQPVNLVQIQHTKAGVTSQCYKIIPSAHQSFKLWRVIITASFSCAVGMHTYSWQ